jgi:hypothetical protein
VKRFQIFLDVGHFRFDNGDIVSHFAYDTATRNVVIDLVLQLPDTFIRDGLLLNDPGNQFDGSGDDGHAVREDSKKQP